MDFFAHHILSVILFTPLAGALLMLFIPRENEQLHKIAGNVFGALGFLVSLPLPTPKAGTDAATDEDRRKVQQEEIGRRLEALGQAGDLSGAAPTLATLEAELQRLYPELARLAAEEE